MDNGEPAARPPRLRPAHPVMRAPARAAVLALLAGAASTAAPAAALQPVVRTGSGAEDFDFAHRRSELPPDRILDQYRDLLEQETLAFTIAQAVEVASVLHPEIRRRRERLAEYPSLVRAARADYLPQLDLTLQAAQTRDPGFRNSPFFSRLLDDPSAAAAGGFGGGDPSAFGGAFTFGTYLWNFQLNQTLWSFRFRPAMDAVDIGRAIATSELNEAENRIARDTAARLYAYLLGERTREVLARALETRERGLELARARLELGAGARLDVLRERVAVSRLRRQLADAEESLRVERAGVNALVGRDQDLEIEVLDRLALPDPMPRVLPAAALMEIATLRRPQLRRYALDREELTARRRLTSADSLPVVRANASYGINTFTLENTYDFGLHNWNAGVTLTWSLFDGLGTGSRLESLRSQETQAEWEQVEFESTLEVLLRRASADWSGALSALEEAALALEEAAEAERVAGEERDAGAATGYWVMEAAQARREVELELAQHTHDALAALAEMKFLVGYPAHAPHSVIADSPAPLPAPAAGGKPVPAGGGNPAPANGGNPAPAGGNPAPAAGSAAPADAGAPAAPEAPEPPRAAPEAPAGENRAPRGLGPSGPETPTETPS